MAENPDLLALTQAGRENRLGHHQRRDWLIARGKTFRQGDHVRLQIVGLATEHIAEPAKSADHLIDQEQHVVLPDTACTFSK